MLCEEERASRSAVKGLSLSQLTTGKSQRDTNFYDHLQSPETRQKMCETVRGFWEDEVRDQHTAMGADCERAQHDPV